MTLESQITRAIEEPVIDTPLVLNYRHRSEGEWLVLPLGRIDGRLYVQICGCITPAVCCRPYVKDHPRRWQLGACMMALNDTRNLHNGHGVAYQTQGDAIRKMYARSTGYRQSPIEAMLTCQNSHLGLASVTSTLRVPPIEGIDGSLRNAIQSSSYHIERGRSGHLVRVTDYTFNDPAPALWRIAIECRKAFNVFKGLR